MNLLTLWPYTNFEHFGIIRFWVIIIIIIIKNEKIRVTLCENAAGALYIVNNAADKQTDSKILPTPMNDTSFQTTIALHSHSLGGDTDEEYGVGSNSMSTFYSCARVWNAAKI